MPDSPKSRDWNAIAAARNIPAPVNTAALEGLIQTVYPLIAALPFETEPAFALASPDAGDGQ